MAGTNLGHFTVTRLRPGYSMAEVDGFIARIRGTLGLEPLVGDLVTADDVRAILFRTTRLNQGYDELEVDAALDRYENELRLLAMTAGEGNGTAEPGRTGELNGASELNGIGELNGTVSPDATAVPNAAGPAGGLALTPNAFTRTRLRPGYAVAEVDQFIARIEGTLGRGPAPEYPVTAEDVRQVRFHTVRLSEGYDETEVDAVLDSYESELRLLEGMTGSQPAVG